MVKSMCAKFSAKIIIFFKNYGAPPWGALKEPILNRVNTALKIQCHIVKIHSYRLLFQRFCPLGLRYAFIELSCVFFLQAFGSWLFGSLTNANAVLLP